jgi:hypothetical protein
MEDDLKREDDLTFFLLKKSNGELKNGRRPKKKK